MFVNISLGIISCHKGRYKVAYPVGFKNKQGDIHIPAVFSALIPFDLNHRAWVNESFDKTNPRWSMIDLRGNYHTDVPYIEVLSLPSNGYKVKTIQGDWNNIDLFGNLIQ